MIISVDNPILSDAIFAVQLSFDQKIAPAILCTPRSDLNYQIEGAGKLFAGNDLVPTFVANEREVGNDGVVIAEDGARAGTKIPIGFFFRYAPKIS